MFKFLNDLLASNFFQVNREATAINSIDLIRKIERDVAHGRLTPVTRFFTVDMTNFYAIIQRQGAWGALVRLILDNECFECNHK
jgi:hypothetical protein